VALLAAGRARASDAAAVPTVEFRADRLELDPALRTLRLSGNAAVRVDRYRLTSDRLTLQTDGGRVRVQGPAVLSLCPCPDPPVTFAFQSAQVTATDVSLTEPTVRAFGVPIFWLPALWLRSPSKWGLLPLKLAYQGTDGVLLGSGVHVPLGGANAGLDLSGAGYVRGGAELEARVVTERTATRVRWDYLRSGSLAFDLRGWQSPGARTGVAWTADVLQGERALRGPALLEEVALRQDRASAAAAWSDSGAIVGVGVGAVASRGAAVGSAGAAGPELHAGWGGALGRQATTNLDVSVATWARPDLAALTLFSGRAELRGDAHAGPVALDVEGRARALATLDESGNGYAAAGAVGAELGAPLVKQFATSSLLEHRVTPFVAGLAGATETRAPAEVPPIAADGSFFTAAAGLRSTLGERSAGRAAVSASARAGWAGDASGARPVFAWRASGHAAGFAARGEGFTQWGTRTGSVVLSTIRAGPEDGLFVEGRAEGASGETALLGRLVASGFSSAWAPWLADSGWSVGGRVGVPWTRWLSSIADADYDATTRVLLGWRGALSYRHPCGCLSATAWAGHRTGRGGADAFVTVGLFP
jgi:hypothetical protein